MSVSYNQPGAKRQKIREAKSSEYVEYFQAIDKIEYNNMASATETSCYRYYSPSERIHSRPMEDWLKLSLSFSHFKTQGYELHGRQTQTRPWDDQTNSYENNKRCLKAFLELCSKLGVRYWTTRDSDLVGCCESWEEWNSFWEDIVECATEWQRVGHVKLLWIEPDFWNQTRYTNGAATNNDANTFLHAATRIKKCLEVSQRLGAECFLICPHREGYDSILQNDIQKELKLLSKLLKMAADYRDRSNYKCQLLILPYYGNRDRTNMENWQHWKWRDNNLVKNYMWDVTSCLYFLKIYNLERFYKVCTPPEHQMHMANVYNMLGGVVIDNSRDPFDIRTSALMMKCIVDQGSPPVGGITLNVTPRRSSDLRDLTVRYVKYIDAVAKGLRLASHIIGDQVFSKNLQQRYSSYQSGMGARVLTSDVPLEECEELCRKSQNPTSEAPTTKSEHFDVLFQRYIDTCDHV